MSYFKGYEKKIENYHKKRRYEIEQRDKNRKVLFEELTKKTKLTKKEKAILKTLKADRKQVSDKDLMQHMVPVREDHKTVRYIRLKNLYNDKWVTRYGRDKLDKCKQNYFNLLEGKPESAIYWDYGI